MLIISPKNSIFRLDIVLNRAKDSVFQSLESLYQLILPLYKLIPLDHREILPLLEPFRLFSIVSYKQHEEHHFFDVNRSIYEAEMMIDTLEDDIIYKFFQERWFSSLSETYAFCLSYEYLFDAMWCKDRISMVQHHAYLHLSIIPVFFSLDRYVFEISNVVNNRVHEPTVHRHSLANQIGVVSGLIMLWEVV